MIRQFLIILNKIAKWMNDLIIHINNDYNETAKITEICPKPNINL